MTCIRSFDKELLLPLASNRKPKKEKMGARNLTKKGKSLVNFTASA